MRRAASGRNAPRIHLRRLVAGERCTASSRSRTPPLSKVGTSGPVAGRLLPAAQGGGPVEGGEAHFGNAASKNPRRGVERITEEMPAV